MYMNVSWQSGLVRHDGRRIFIFRILALRLGSEEPIADCQWPIADGE
jgi:hypothetical protein